jgi:LCP family protein required for cell wall assembly
MSSGPRRPAPSSRPQSSRPKLRNQLLFVVAILAISGGAFYTALIVASQTREIFFPGLQLPDTIAKLPGVKGESNDGDIGGGRINVLVLGLDRRPREGQAPTRTDTMFVMTVDPSTHSARGLAMPRDLWVDIPTPNGGTVKERINAAYVLGETRNYPGGGAATARATVEKLLDIKIQYHVLIDFEGFKQVIDLLGGIDVEVPSPGVNDPTYSETELLGDYYPCVFQPGLHHMNGSDALCFSRVRRNSSDLDRILRQQRVILAVMDKATQLNVLADITNVTNLYKRYKGAIQTDINELQVPGFAKLAASIDQNQLAFLSLAPATTPWTTPEGASVLLYSKEGIDTIVRALLSDNRLLTEAAVVEVQNGTGETGRATRAVEYLTSLGLPASNLVAINAAQTGVTRTDIIDFGGKPYSAERIADWLGVPRDRVRKAAPGDEALRAAPTSDIVVILGADAKLESAAAQQPPTR